MIAGIFLLSAFVDAPSYLSTGAVSLMGLLSGLLAVGIALAVAAQPRPSSRALWSLWPLSSLFLYSMLQLFWTNRSVQALQTLCLQWIFLGLAVLMMTSEDAAADREQAARLMPRAMLCGAFCFVIVLMIAGFGSEGIGAISFITARSFALFALLGIAYFLGRWATGLRWSLSPALGLIALIAFSLSRTALVVAVLMVPLSRFRSLTMRDFRRFLVFGAIAVVTLYFLVFSVDALRVRFLGSSSLDDYLSGDASVDTNGRITAWGVTLASYAEAPWLGKGPGSANDLISDVLSRLELGHPHNEYLRFLHDEGAVGLVLLMAGLVQLLLRCRLAFRKSLEGGHPDAPLHLASFLALTAVMLTMLTDNTASYIFVMGPLAVLVGVSLRASQRTELVGRAIHKGLPTAEGTLG